MLGSRAALLLLVACASVPPSTTGLRAQKQALLDAVSAGDARVWERYLDPDASYVAEDGTIETKASLVAQVTPLPAGISGTLKIGRFDVKQFGDTAVVVHDSNETVDYFGHPLAVVYRNTDVWRYARGGWRLIASQVHAVQKDPPAVTLPAEQLDDYVGTYALPATTYTIRRDGAALVGQRAGGKPQPLRVEIRDVLFTPGQPRSRKLFARDANGRITGFADRREGHDIVWQRR